MKRLLFLAPCAFLLISCSLAGDVTPPPGYKPPTPRPTDLPLEGPLYPLEAPSPARGAQIYASECAPCHGATGLGDGPDASQLRDQNIAVPPLGLPDFARLATPERWYTIVTQGNLKRFMPPFRSLNDAQRWDVVAYALSLSVTPDDLTAGQSLYETNCAKCHTEGEVVFTDQERMAGLTHAMIASTIAAGKGKMPAFADLTETQRRQLAVYVRSLSFATGETVTPTLEASATVSAVAGEPSQLEANSTLSGTVTISGTISAPDGASVPAGLEVTLYAFEQLDPHPLLAFTLTVQTSQEGTFLFREVPIQVGQVVGAAVEYQNVLYGSRAADVTEADSVLFLPIEIYEATSDTSGLVVDRHHLIFTFDTPGQISVMEMYAISNPSGQTVAAAPGEPLVFFPLPLGAENLELQSGALGERFLSVAGGIADTEPINPGSGAYQVTFAYTLPYEDRLDFSQPVNLSTTAVTVLVPESGIRVAGDALQDGGIFQGMDFRRYDAADLPADTVLAFTLSGEPENSTATSTAAQPDNPMNLAIGLGTLGIVLIGLGVWFYLRTRKVDLSDTETGTQVDAETEAEPALQDADSLMDAIIALDDQFRTGQIPEDAYRRRRAELKANLQKILEK